MIFVRPEWLALLLVVPILVRRPAPIRSWSPTPLRWAEGFAHPAVRRARHLPAVTLAGAVALLVVAAAGPTVERPAERPPEASVAVMLVIDVSGSMREVAAGGSALDRTRSAIERMVRESSGYRVGVVAFAGSALTRLPPTTDTALVLGTLENLELGVRENGSAIGTGLGLAVDRLSNTRAAARAVVLVTDGRHNAGPIAPETALGLAAENGVVVHALFPTGSPEVEDLGARIEEAGGQAIRAIGGADAVQRALTELVPALPTPGEPRRAEFATPWLLAATLLLALSIGLRATRLGGVR